MRILITGTATELGRELLLQLAGKGHQITGLVERQSGAAVVSQSGVEPVLADLTDARDMARAVHEARAEVILNLAPQESNSLLHDGHAWRSSEKLLPAQTRALLQAANENDVSYLVHTSYAFLYGNSTERFADESTPLSSPPKNKLFSAAIEAEKMVAGNKQFPVCILRIGYLYGPQSRDLALYERSFKLRRPYYAGSREHVGNFVHFSDAARAVVLAAEKQPPNEIVNIVDGTAVSFSTFIDAYAKHLGRPKPHRLPQTAVRFLPLLIHPQQIKQLNIHAAQVENSKARDLLDWTPQIKEIRF